MCVGLDGGDEVSNHGLHGGHLRLERLDSLDSSVGGARLGGWLFEDAFDAGCPAAATGRVLWAIASGLLLATGIAGTMDSGDGFVDLVTVCGEGLAGLGVVVSGGAVGARRGVAARIRHDGWMLFLRSVEVCWAELHVLCARQLSRLCSSQQSHDQG